MTPDLDAIRARSEGILRAYETSRHVPSGHDWKEEARRLAADCRALVEELERLSREAH